MRCERATWVLVGVCVVAFPAVYGAAQTPASAADRFAWTQTASADEISGLTFAIVIDGARAQLPDASCAPTSRADRYTCVASSPPIAPGQHTIAIVAIRTDGETTLESEPSAPIQCVVSMRRLRSGLARFFGGS